MRKIFLLILFLGINSCLGVEKPQYFPIYGKYCGKDAIMPSMVQQTSPDNVIDYLCSERLVCVSRHGKQNIKTCDKIFVSELKKLDLQNPQEKKIVKAMIRFLK